MTGREPAGTAHRIQSPVGFLAGDRVELTAVSDDYRQFALTAGDQGSVEFTDSLGTIHIRWDSGRRIGIISEAAGLIRKAHRGKGAVSRPAPGGTT